MKTRILSLALALAVCLGLMVPAAASHLQGNNGSDQGGLPMETGATEIVGKNGYVFTLSQPVIGPISNFEYQDNDGEVMTIKDTYYLLPYGTDISIARPDGSPARFEGVSFPGGAGEAYMEDYPTLTLSLTGPVQLISEGGSLFLYGIEDPPTAGPGTESGFSDVKEGDFFAEPVLWAVDKGVTTGTGDGSTFSPDKTCTRGEIVTFLFRALA